MEIENEEPCSSVSFCQRKIFGFRERIEFDKKRIIVMQGNELTIIGFDHFDNTFKLYSSIE